MKIESFPVTMKSPELLPAPVESVEAPRPSPLRPDPPPAEGKGSAKIAPEEILERIKALTEDGVYSVRFEKSDEHDRVIIKLVESDTGELIRQIPPEELLGTSKFLKELRGNMVNTET